MTALSAGMMLLLAGTLSERPTIVVQAPDSPVRLEHVTVLTGAEGPPVLLYAAINKTDEELEQFTVMAYIFAADGRLKAKQLAPGRRTLEARSTKYSTMVLDGRAVTATDRVVVGVNQVQRTDSDKWWSAELEAAAKEAVKKQQPLHPSD